MMKPRVGTAAFKAADAMTKPRVGATTFQAADAMTKPCKIRPLVGNYVHESKPRKIRGRKDFRQKGG